MLTNFFPAEDIRHRNGSAEEKPQPQQPNRPLADNVQGRVASPSRRPIFCGLHEPAEANRCLYRLWGKAACSIGRGARLRLLHRQMPSLSERCCRREFIWQGARPGLRRSIYEVSGRVEVNLDTQAYNMSTRFKSFKFHYESTNVLLFKY